MSYGKHQSFYIKKNWISKSLYSISNNNQIFYDGNGYKLMGLGKNMFQSLKFWTEASNIAELQSKKHELTYFGNLLIQYDLSCSLNLSKNLIHYFINQDRIPLNNMSKDYFSVSKIIFNDINDIVFTKEDLFRQIVEQNQVNGISISFNTIKRDIDCFINLYSNFELAHPEDKNVSIIGDLRLIEKNDSNGNSYFKKRISNDMLSIEALYFIILEMNEKYGGYLTLDILLNAENSIGRLFNLSRMDLIDIIERMSLKPYNYSIKITRTNNIDNIIIENIMNPIDFLKEVYGELQ